MLSWERESSTDHHPPLPGTSVFFLPLSLVWVKTTLAKEEGERKKCITLSKGHELRREKEENTDGIHWVNEWTFTNADKRLIKTSRGEEDWLFSSLDSLWFQESGDDRESKNWTSPLWRPTQPIIRREWGESSVMIDPFSFLFLLSHWMESPSYSTSFFFLHLDVTISM
jgi:hypothetical protein